MQLFGIKSISFAVGAQAVCPAGSIPIRHSDTKLPANLNAGIVGATRILGCVAKTALWTQMLQNGVSVVTGATSRCPTGMTKLTQDLNEGAGASAAPVFMCVRLASAVVVPSAIITGLAVVSGSPAPPPDKYSCIPSDLNAMAAGAGGSGLFLCQRLYQPKIDVCGTAEDSFPTPQQQQAVATTGAYLTSALGLASPGFEGATIELVYHVWHHTSVNFSDVSDGVLDNQTDALNAGYNFTGFKFVHVATKRIKNAALCTAEVLNCSATGVAPNRIAAYMGDFGTLNVRECTNTCSARTSPVHARTQYTPPPHRSTHQYSSARCVTLAGWLHMCVQTAAFKHAVLAGTGWLARRGCCICANRPTQARACLINAGM